MGKSTEFGVVFLVEKNVFGFDVTVDDVVSFVKEVDSRHHSIYEVGKEHKKKEEVNKKRRYTYIIYTQEGFCHVWRGRVG